MSASTPFDGLKIAPNARVPSGSEEAPIAAAKEPRTNPRRFMPVPPLKVPVFRFGSTEGPALRLNRTERPAPHFAPLCDLRQTLGEFDRRCVRAANLAPKFPRKQLAASGSYAH